MIYDVVTLRWFYKTSPCSSTMQPRRMAARLLIVFITVSWCIYCVQTHGSIKAVIEKVDRIDDDLLDLKMDLPRLEEQFHNEIDYLRVSLRADLLNNMVPEYMEKQVKDYIVQTLRSQSLEELLNSQTGAEVRQLKQELRLMKRKYQRVSSNLRITDLQRTQMTDMLLKRNEELEGRVETLEKVSEKSQKRLKRLEMENSHLSISLRVMNVSLRDEVDGECGCGSGGNKNRTVSDRVETLEKVSEKSAERLKHLEMESSNLNTSLRVMNVSLRDEIDDRVGSLEQASREVRIMVKDQLMSRIEILEQGSEDENKILHDVESQYSFLNRSLRILNASLTAEVESECGCSLRGTKNETIATRFQTLELITSEADKRLQSLEFQNFNTINSLEKMNVALTAEVESECGCATMKNRNGTIHTRVKTLERVSNDTEQRIQDLESKSSHLKSSFEQINQSLSMELERGCGNAHQLNRSYIINSSSSVTQMFKKQYTRLILAPRSTNDKQFMQLSIHDNTHKNYMYLNIQYTEAIAYDPKSRKLFISRHGPNKIYSSQLDTTEVTLLREGIASYGMAVDVIRQILFMTTYVPSHTVSRMTIDGKHFRPVVDLTGHGNYPRAITVDPRHRQIYVTVVNKLLSVDYTGSNLHTLTTGSDIVSLIMDYTNNWLFYNDNKKVMRRSLDGTSTMVTELTGYPLSYQFYNNTLYMSYDKHIDAVYFINETKLPFRLKSLTKLYLLCLVPDP